MTIFSHKRIAMHYLRGWFFIDLIACLPWEEMATVVSSGAAGSVFVKILKSCKALRLLRLSRLFKFLEQQQLIGHVMRMMRMLFFFFLFAHWVACLWYALGAYYFTHSEGVDGWLPACAPPLDPEASPFSDLYVTSLYWVLTTWVTVVRWIGNAAQQERAMERTLLPARSVVPHGLRFAVVSSLLCMFARATVTCSPAPTSKSVSR